MINKKPEAAEGEIKQVLNHPDSPVTIHTLHSKQLAIMEREENSLRAVHRKVRRHKSFKSPTALPLTLPRPRDQNILLDPVTSLDPVE